MLAATKMSPGFCPVQPESHDNQKFQIYEIVRQPPLHDVHLKALTAAFAAPTVVMRRATSSTQMPT